MYCDTNNGFIYNWGNCKCSRFSQSADIYNLQNEIVEYIKHVSTTLETDIDIHEYLIKFWEIYDDATTTLSNLEQDFDTLDLVEYTIRIQEIITRFRTTQEEWEEELRSTQTCTSTQCQQNVQMLVRGCVCYASPEVSTFYQQLNNFITVENSILAYNGPGSPSELQEFVTRTDTIRDLFNQLHDYFVNNYDNYDMNVINNLLNQIIDAVAQVNFTNFFKFSFKAHDLNLNFAS